MTVEEIGMNQSRFEALAEAYGADLRRWPAAERGAADTFRALHPEISRTILQRADDLDHLLAAAPVVAPSAALRQAVRERAPGRAGTDHDVVAGDLLHDASAPQAGLPATVNGTPHISPTLTRSAAVSGGSGMPDARRVFSRSAARSPG